MFSRILIANRGEIACRVIRTAKRLGIYCIAVYSEADKQALHVKLADEAYYLGPAPARDSYLNKEKILAIAKQSGAEAIHPGYGFLSENTDFAEACAANHIVFIGPPAMAIEAMGSKSNAKTLMAKAGVPLIPGYHGLDQSSQAFIQAAEKIGYPVLLKAAAGGGGKGMRVVNQAREMENALAAAKREGLSSFGDDFILLEKYLAKPRHVEIQVFSDKHGHHLYLHERDCSIQRRHQKIIEEAPAPGMLPELREKMGAAAVACAKAINYCGAGTIEFLLDTDGQFYFMEMNTRLQVEHPVTEMITGLDLVEWQLRVAAGEKLPLTQADIPLQGHAIEVRIYAEDPAEDFLPSIGHITYLQQPATTPYVRIDTGVEQGSEISQYYDPMIAKLIVWGSDREEAILRLTQALMHYRVAGVQTNLALLAQIAQHEVYQKGLLFTHFIQAYHQDLFTQPTHPEELIIAAALWQQQQNKTSPTGSPWFEGLAWRMNLPAEQYIAFKVGDKLYQIRFIADNQHYQVWLDEQAFTVELLAVVAQGLRLSINGKQTNYQIITQQQKFTVFNELQQLVLIHQQDNWEQESASTGGHLRAPMPGTVTAVLVKAGQQVKKGEALIIIEAMKMEHTIQAGSDGQIEEISYKIGDSVQEGAELVTMKGE